MICRWFNDGRWRLISLQPQDYSLYVHLKNLFPYSCWAYIKSEE